MHGRAVGFVEGSFEHIRDTEFIRYLHILLARLERRIKVFQYIDATEQNKRFVVADRNVVNLNIHNHPFVLTDKKFQIYAKAV